MPKNGCYIKREYVYAVIVIQFLACILLAISCGELSQSLKEAEKHISSLKTDILAIQKQLEQSPPPPPPPEEFTPLFPSGNPQLNLASPGVDLSYYTPNISWPLNVSINAGSTVYPALQAKGTIVAVDLIVDNIFFKTYRGTRNLSDWYAAIDQMNAAVCDPETICAHGSLVFCVCRCETGWSGTLCDHHDCNGLGTWNTTTGSCLCDDSTRNSSAFCLTPSCPEDRGIYSNVDNKCHCLPGWTGTNCETAFTNCTEQCVRGDCIDGVCVCDGPAFGKWCQYDCSEPTPNNTLCPYRSNWGVDMPCIAEEETLEKICVCGGGFSLTADETVVHQLRCGSNVSLSECHTRFSDEREFCCLPGSPCGAPTSMCDTDSCCRSQGNYANETSCLISGCAWCSGSCVLGGTSGCLFPGYTAAQFIYDASKSSENTNMWEQTRYPVIYDQSAANVYRRLFAPCIYNLYLEIECAQQVYRDIQSLAWPSLDTDEDFPAQIPSNIVLQSTDSNLCRDQYPVLSLATVPRYFSRNVSVGWQCPGQDGTNGVFLTYAHGSLESGRTHYHVLKATRGGDVFCLVQGPLNATMKYWIFGTVSAEDTLFWFNLREQGRDYVITDPAPFCTRWYVTGNSLRGEGDSYIRAEGLMATLSQYSGGYLDFVAYSSAYPKKLS